MPAPSATGENGLSSFEPEIDPKADAGDSNRLAMPPPRTNARLAEGEERSFDTNYTKIVETFDDMSLKEDLLVSEALGEKCLALRPSVCGASPPH
jgi:hypothetical protein